jgi:hypothetical protein
MIWSAWYTTQGSPGPITGAGVAAGGTDDGDAGAEMEGVVAGVAAADAAGGEPVPVGPPAVQPASMSATTSDPKAT